MNNIKQSSKSLVGHEIKLLNDCDATLIPTGQPLLLVKDTVVRVTQALGDSVTVEVDGNLVLIHEEDVASIGLEPDLSYLKMSRINLSILNNELGLS